MLELILIFIVALYLIVHGSTIATTYAKKLADSFHLSKYAVGFIVIAVISILPETFIAINAAMEGDVAFGLGVLLGSNVADLTLIFAMCVLSSGRSLKIGPSVLKQHYVFPFLLLLPGVLGLDGYYSRIEGAALILTGVLFQYFELRNGMKRTPTSKNEVNRFTSAAFLVLSMAILLAGAHYVVTSATQIAHLLHLSPVLIGIVIVGLGTTVPELFFSLKSIDKREDSLAIGDLLGTVLADATIVIGILTLVSPFAFPQKIIYVAGGFMVVAAFILFYFMKSGRVITKREALWLCAFWATFAITEFLVNT